MNEDLIADLWNVTIEHIPEKQRPSVASEFVNVLMDYDIKESTLTSLLGVDPFLDDAINYVIDDEFEDEIIDDDDVDNYGYNDED